MEGKRAFSASLLWVPGGGGGVRSVDVVLLLLLLVVGGEDSMAARVGMSSPWVYWIW